MIEKTKTIVTVGGHEYTIVGTDATEHILRVASYVDRRLTDMQTASRLSPGNVAVLTAMNIADEMLKAKDENARLRVELGKITAEHKAAQNA